MAKTLNQLIEEATLILRQLTSGGIPIRCRGCEEIELELCGENGNYWVDVKLKRKQISVEEFKKLVNKKEE